MHPSDRNRNQPVFARLGGRPGWPPALAVLARSAWLAPAILADYILAMRRRVLRGVLGTAVTTLLLLESIVNGGQSRTEQ